MNPTPQQERFYSWTSEAKESGVLEAVAGSGKTTTLIGGLERMPGRKFFGAFNKRIVEDIRVKAGEVEGLTIQTMHAVGFAAWRARVKGVKVDEKKLEHLAEQSSISEYLRFPAMKLVDLAKQALITPDSSENRWFDLIEHFGVEVPEGEEGNIVEAAQELLKLSIDADFQTIDFADMIYAPLVHNVPLPKFDWVLIDEAQDTNASRRELALRMRGDRLIAVGDRHQAIYGFTGADADALDRIGSATSATKLPLTVSFRCPKQVVAEAQRFVSHIEAADWAQEGVVREGRASEAQRGDVVLSRFNKYLLPLAYDFLKYGRACKIEGRDIGAGIKALIRRWKISDLSALQARLEVYFEKESAKLSAKGRFGQLMALEDRVECLSFFIQQQLEKGGNIWSLNAEIDSLFVDGATSKDVITLSSIHKSKGREWPRVFWLQTPPLRWKQQDWELGQETNLSYVAITRAQEELILAEVK